MKPEQRFWRNTLQPAMKDIQNLQFERIEPSTGASGMPDVVYTLGRTGWIENKWSNRRNLVDLDGWSVDQRRWARNHVGAGATLFLCIGGPVHHRLLRVDEALTHEDLIECNHPAVVATFEGRIDRAVLARTLYIK